MTSFKHYLTLVGILAVVVAINAVITLQIVKPSKLDFSELAGAAGNMLAENYDPYVMYNDGYNSAKDIVTSATLKTTGTLQVGSSGTAQVNQVVTSCTPLNTNTSIAATSTGYIYCTGVTGLTSADIVVAQFATSSLAAVTSNFVIVGSKASTTAGAVDMIVLNLTGAARAISAASKIASTTNLFIGH